MTPRRFLDSAAPWQLLAAVILAASIVYQAPILRDHDVAYLLTQRLAAAGRSRALSRYHRSQPAALGASVARGSRQYAVDGAVQSARSGLLRIVQDPRMAAALDRCNTFHFHQHDGQHPPEDRMGQFFFARHVVERVRRNDPLRTCVVDLINETVRGAF